MLMISSATMKPENKKVPDQGSSGIFHKLVRFDDLSHVDAIRKAAKQRGWSVNTFIVRAAYVAAQRELEVPSPQLFGFPVQGINHSEASDDAVA